VCLRLRSWAPVLSRELPSLIHHVLNPPVYNSVCNSAAVLPFVPQRLRE